MKLIAFLRSLVVALIYPLVVLGYAIVIVVLGYFPGARAIQDRVVGHWAKISLILFGVSIDVVGLEKLPAGGYIGLFNHTSNFDILAIQALIPRIRFGAKIELFRIPVFGSAMRAAKALPIARARREEVLKVYEEAKGRLLEGECFILSPEGTRQKQEKLGPFKSGPFLFAINAQVPVVPMAIKGASKIQPKSALLPNSHAWNSKIQVIIGEPIPTLGLTADEKKKLQTQVMSAFYQMGLD